MYPSTAGRIPSQWLEQVFQERFTGHREAPDLGSYVCLLLSKCQDRISGQNVLSELALSLCPRMTLQQLTGSVAVKPGAYRRSGTR